MTPQCISSQFLARRGNLTLRVFRIFWQGRHRSHRLPTLYDVLSDVTEDRIRSSITNLVIHGVVQRLERGVYAVAPGVIISRDAQQLLDIFGHRLSMESLRKEHAQEER